LRPAPQGFDQMRPRSTDRQGRYHPVSALSVGRAIITIWSNLNVSYLPDRTLAEL